jgi:NAD(P)-dependent dehydrogenase (short-subunit alcohol dehydrogenase family)
MSAHQTIIVTGASRGIGAATALELARRGFTVGCLSRSGTIPVFEKPEDHTLATRLLPQVCDVTDETSVIAAFSAIAEKTGGISGLVNNAGIHREGLARKLPTAELQAVLMANTVSPFVAAREAYPYLVDAGGGLIVNIGSFFDRIGARGSIAYCASKAAVAAMTRVMAAEWGVKGISVLNIAPGFIETDVNKEYLSDPAIRAQVSASTFVGRPGRTDEVARLVSALFSEKIQFLTGETICIDGGQSVSL